MTTLATTRPQHAGWHLFTGYVRSVLLLGVLSAIIVAVAYAAGGGRAADWAIAFALLMNIGSWFWSDRLVLAMHRAVPLPESEAPRLYRIVRALAARAGIPEPPIYLVDDPAPNAFATGRSPRHAAVAVTSGALRLLDDDELTGVLAHELSHVKNRDTLISTIAATLAGAVALLAQFLSFDLWFGGGRGDRDDRTGYGLIAALVAPLAATLVQLAVSRSRELAADASGARLMGTGEPLARALEDLDSASARIPMLTARPATSHLYIVPPGHGTWRTLLSTHPDTAERIYRLRTGRY